MFSLLKLFILQTKEMLGMTFTTESGIANSYAVLILAGRRTMDQVPDVGNLRAIVNEILTGE